MTLRNEAFQLYKKNATGEWVISFTFTLITCAILLLNFAAGGLSLLLIPFVVMPFLFATYMSHIGFGHNQPVTLRNHGRYFLGYYSAPYNSSFSFIPTVFKTLGIYILSSFLFSLIAYFSYRNNATFVNFYNEFQNLLTSTTFTVDTLTSFFSDNQETILMIALVSSFPPAMLSTLAFIYFITYNSSLLYFKVHHPQLPSPFHRLVHNKVKKSCRGSLLKDYWSLNWPLIALFIAGAALGSYLGYLYQKQINSMLTLGIIGGLLVMFFYLPFYFPNSEVLYQKYLPYYERAAKDVMNETLTSLQSQMDNNEQNNQMIQEMMDQLKKEQEKEKNDKSDDSSDSKEK